MTSKSQNSVNQAHALAARAASGVGWVYASYAAGKLLVFLTTIILARLLDVEAFGLVSYALIVVNYLDVVKDLGISSAIIAHPQGITSERVRSTAFFLTVLAGLFMTLAALLLAPLAASFFGEPSATGLTQVLGLTLLLSGFGRTHDAILRKELSFRRKIVPDLAQSLVKGSTSITLALLGFGPWSIVWGQVAGTAAGSLLSWLVFPWIPKFAFDRQVAVDLLSFGSQLIGVNIVSALVLNSDYLVVGRFLGTEALGIYTLAYRLPEMLLVTLSWVLSIVLFPLFAQLRPDGCALAKALLTSSRVIAAVTIPLGFGIAATAPTLIPVVFGDKWTLAVPSMQLLALSATLHATFFQTGDAFKALGQGSVLLRHRIQMAMVLLPIMLAGLQLFGLAGVALAWIIAEAFYAGLNLRVLRRITGVQAHEMVLQLRAPLASGVVMLLPVGLAGQLQPEPGWPGLIAQFMLGTLTYSVTLSALDPWFLRHFRARLSSQPGPLFPSVQD